MLDLDKHSTAVNAVLHPMPITLTSLYLRLPSSPVLILTADQMVPIYSRGSETALDVRGRAIQGVVGGAVFSKTDEYHKKNSQARFDLPATIVQDAGAGN